jgi:hypothetical protein
VRAECTACEKGSADKDEENSCHEVKSRENRRTFKWQRRMRPRPSSSDCQSNEMTRYSEVTPQRRKLSSADEFVLYKNDNCFCLRAIWVGLCPMKRRSDRVRCAWSK